jgi:hypothetical protein
MIAKATQRRARRGLLGTHAALPHQVACSREKKKERKRQRYSKKKRE